MNEYSNDNQMKKILIFNLENAYHIKHVFI